jgi:hypothetical protein
VSRLPSVGRKRTSGQKWPRPRFAQCGNYPQVINNFPTNELWEDSFTIHNHDFPTQYSPIGIYNGSTQRSPCTTDWVMQINVNPQSAVPWLKRLITREASARFRASPCAICGGKSYTEIGFLRVLLFPISVLFPQCSIIIFILTLLLPERETGEAWEHSDKTVLFLISNKHRTEGSFLFFSVKVCCIIQIISHDTI